jgi:CDP-glycerol glycerophosphotransferase
MARNATTSAVRRALARLGGPLAPAARTFGLNAMSRRLGELSQSTSRTDPAPPRPTAASAAPPVPDAEPALISRLARIAWASAGDRPRLRIEGSAWRRGGEQPGSQISAVSLHIDGRRISFEVSGFSSPALNDHSPVPSEDHSDAGFVATLAAEQLRAVIPDDATFELTGQVQITISDREGELIGGFVQRDETGSAGQPHSGGIGNDCLVRPGWDAERGLLITIARPEVAAERIGFSGMTLQADLVVGGDFKPTRAELRAGDRVQRLKLRRHGRRLVAVGDLAGLIPRALDPAAQQWQLQLVDRQRRARRVHWQGPIDQRLYYVSQADPRLAVRYAPNGVIRVEVRRARLAADQVRIESPVPSQPRLIISGEFHNLPTEPTSWTLVGGRLRIPASELAVDGDRFRAGFDLLCTPEWGDRPMPLPSASYALTVKLQAPAGQRGEIRAEIEPSLAQALPQSWATEGNRILAKRTPYGRLSFAVGPPLADGATSPYNHRRLEDRHRTVPVQLTDAVLFTSFNGRATNDNTRAVHDEIIRRRSDLRRMWTVADLSVEVPDGAEPVIFRSEEWWRALGSSRYVVTNCWMPKRFTRHEDQQVLQTWHGTPLKLLGFDRLGTRRGAAYRTRTMREVEQWLYLIAQNPFSSNVFRSAYGYQGNVLEIGYPRNDILSTAGSEHGRAVRKQLGIADDELVVLYTPTWREGAGKIFADLDLDALQRAIGDRGRLLVRGHVNTIPHGGRLQGPALLDVTMYQQLSDLYLISDVMITDYSSTMFDFSVTGKPMIFFVPDIDEYAGRRRGTYFDLGAEAPGPLFRTTGEVVAALEDIDLLRSRYADRYTGWQQKFNPYDDGHASERAVDALFDER